MPIKKKVPAQKPAAKSAKSAKADNELNYALKPGTRAPAFSLSDDTGKTRTLADFKGRKLVIYFYPKDNTPGCTQESCDFRDNVNRLTSSGAAVVGVSADSAASHAGFKKKYGFNFPLLSDPERSMIKAYSVWQKKSLYGREYMGIMRTTYIVDEKGVITHAFSRVKVTGHVDEVLKAL